VDNEAIKKSLRDMTEKPALKKPPRGWLDSVSVEIYEATRAGRSLHDIVNMLGQMHGVKVTVTGVSKALKRNKLVSGGPNPGSHNV